jgi:CBS domain-containing protein
MLAKISAGEFMSPNPIYFGPNTDVFEAIRSLLKHKITGAPVLDDTGKIIGAFSELDCLRITLTSTYYEHMGGKVSEHMTTDVTTIDSETSILEVAEIFTRSNLRHFPIVGKGKLVGVISRVDVLKALLAGC